MRTKTDIFTLSHSLQDLLRKVTSLARQIFLITWQVLTWYPFTKPTNIPTMPWLANLAQCKLLWLVIMHNLPFFCKESGYFLFQSQNCWKELKFLDYFSKCEKTPHCSSSHIPDWMKLQIFIPHNHFAAV